MRKEARHTQMRDRASGVHPNILDHLPPKNIPPPPAAPGPGAAAAAPSPSGGLRRTAAAGVTEVAHGKPGLGAGPEGRRFGRAENGGRGRLTGEGGGGVLDWGVWGVRGCRRAGSSWRRGRTLALGGVGFPAGRATACQGRARRRTAPSPSPVTIGFLKATQPPSPSPPPPKQIFFFFNVLLLVDIAKHPISRSPLGKNPMPGHLSELHPVNEVNTKGQ